MMQSIHRPVQLFLYWGRCQPDLLPQQSVVTAVLEDVLFIPVLYFLKSGIAKSTEWSMIPACPSLICFVNRGNTKGTDFFQKFYA